MLRKILNTFIICIICIVPLIITPWELDYYYHPKIFIIYIISFIASLLYLVFLINTNHSHSKLDNYAAIYILLVVLSTIFSINKSQSFSGRLLREEGVFAICCYVFLFQLTSKFYSFSPRHINFFIFSAVLISFYAIAQYFGFDPVPVDAFRGSWEGYSFGTLGNPNFLGSYLTLILPISIFSFIRSKNLLYLFSSGILYFCLICSKTRGAWIGFFLSLLLLVWLIYINKINFRLIFVVITMFAFITLGHDYLSGREFSQRAISIARDAKLIITKSPERDKAGSTRFFIWKNALKLIPGRPLLGYGPDTFDIVFMGNFKEEAKKYFGELIVDKAHNEYIQIAVTTGIPSLLVYLLIPGTLLITGLKNVHKNILIIPLLCSILGYLVQGFFNISVVSVAPVFYILMGVLNNSIEDPL